MRSREPIMTIGFLVRRLNTEPSAHKGFKTNFFDFIYLLLVGSIRL